jgi:hypothetical protein
MVETPHPMVSHSTILCEKAEKRKRRRKRKTKRKRTRKTKRKRTPSSTKDNVPKDRESDKKLDRFYFLLKSDRYYTAVPFDFTENEKMAGNRIKLQSLSSLLSSLFSLLSLVFFIILLGHFSP